MSCPEYIPVPCPIPETPEEMQALKTKLQGLLDTWPTVLSESFAGYNKNILAMTAKGYFRQLSTSDMVPGHLQTASYATELINNVDARGSEKQRAYGVQARVGRSAILMASEARQEYLLSPRMYEDPYPSISKPTLREQLGHLIALPQQREQVSIRLLAEHDTSNKEFIDITSTDGNDARAVFSAWPYSYELSDAGTKDAIANWQEVSELALPVEASHDLLVKAYERLL